MNSRRLFLSGAAVAIIGGGSATMFTAPVATRRRSVEPVTRELHRQLRAGIQKLLDDDGEGARQVASTLSIYAATLSDDQIRAEVHHVVEARGRQAILSAPINHAEMQQMAAELGIPSSMLALHHEADISSRDEALTMLLREGLTPSMKRAAAGIDAFSRELDARRANIRSVALQIPDCWVCAAADRAKTQADIVCGIVAVGCLVTPPVCPELIALCAAAEATWLSLSAACWAAQQGGLC